eukprot:365294-Chlamydomonas_euryale.AAC.2
MTWHACHGPNLGVRTFQHGMHATVQLWSQLGCGHEAWSTSKGGVPERWPLAVTCMDLPCRA